MNSYLPFICLNRKRLAPWRQMNTSRSILSWRRSLMMKSVMTTGAIDQLRLFWHQLVAVWWNFPNFSVPSLLNNKYNHVVFRVIWLLLVWRFELQQNHVRKLDFLCEATEISFIIHIKAGFESNKLYLRSCFPFISIRGTLWLKYGPGKSSTLLCSPSDLTIMILKSSFLSIWDHSLLCGCWVLWPYSI